MNRTWIASAIAIGLLLAALPLSYQLWPARTPVTAALSNGAQVGGPFELQDQHGRAVNEQTFSGQWLLVFFGFTRCADICPATLMHMAKVLDGLGEQARQVQPLFISLDPERDTPDVLAAYTSFFDERILGLTGSVEQIRQVADAYSVYFQKVPMGDTYMLDHTGSIYLMGPKGELAELFSQRMTAEAMVQAISSSIGQP
ncbi:SCO family protein [Pseudomonas daroniae]|uniref:SCO family protein n=1 Tax=Phytopseudomonas daroniae TaxID=2487519 RepID=A0A4Q9QIF8_9GAMM|nr:MULTISPECIES: SCO family protein [Pseudomonas]TBU71017.1 SCO family protein [Pseudomonas daroniae]TBU75801.1 SCO family protein [Pseudomonas daroniae]TBU80596.1 SCO family protein [Pseudomonas sp. FRB 228]TBU89579.1 SCO family protein [Pseudomonas daroniae]